MSELSFNEEQPFVQGRSIAGKQSFLAGLILKIGIANDEKNAKLILSILALVLFGIALLFWFLRSSETGTTPSSEVLRQAGQQQTLP